MRAEIRYFEWPDLERATAGPPPEVTLLIFAAGPLGSAGEETFQAKVCTPRGLVTLLERDGIVFGRHYIFATSIDPKRVEAAVEARLRRLDGDSWSDLAEKIGRIGYWDFEEYREAT
jgi:hypothetical protein